MKSKAVLYLEEMEKKDVIFKLIPENIGKSRNIWKTIRRHNHEIK